MAIIKALYPDVDVMVVALAAGAGRAGPQASSATVVDPFPVEQLLEEAAAWSGGVLNKFGGQHAAHGAPRRRFPDVVYDTIGTAQTAGDRRPPR